MIDFQKPYSRENFIPFLRDFLPDWATFVEKDIVKEKYWNFITQAKIIAEEPSLWIKVIEVIQKSENDPRISITKEIFKLMPDNRVKKALVVFTNPITKNWRLSLVTLSFDIDEQSKIVKKYSNARRYSFYLWEKAKVRTPQKYLEKKVLDFEDLLKRFSVEVVNKDFYNSIAKSFKALVSPDVDTSIQMKLPNILETNSQTSQEFAVRLIGRIVFCWFLKQKWGQESIIISDEILSYKSVSKYKNYYHEILEPLFFEVLNKDKEKRKDTYKKWVFENIPYLNWWLFSAHKHDFYEEKYKDSLIISNQWFEDFFSLLETYNFTIDENTLIDQELSVDPEMLGRIFENLLAEINPETWESARNSTWSFYTPREIVEYMVDESITAYLSNKTDIHESKLRALLSIDQNDDDDFPLSLEEKTQILDAIDNLTIIDPACGSWAYPIGILQKILYVLQIIDSTWNLWFQKKIAKIDNEILVNIIKRQFENENLDYIRKIWIIKHSIFWVDIQPIAIEISKLRCFLTLIVEEHFNPLEENSWIIPLPNLEFNFVCANTLVKLPSKMELWEDWKLEEKLKSLREQYFDPKIPSDQKEKIKNDYKALIRQDKIFWVSEREELIRTYDPFDPEMSANFFEPNLMLGVKKFHICIGNPPYIQLQDKKKIPQEVQNLLWKQWYATFKKTGDIYALFYERGLELTRAKEWLLCYITSNKWMRALYGEPLRQFFAERKSLRLLDFWGFKVFESATVDTAILLIQNHVIQKDELYACKFSNNDFKKGDSIIEYFNSKKVTLTFLNSDIWFTWSKEEIWLKFKISQKGIILKEHNIAINSWVKTSCNELFIIDENVKNIILSREKTAIDIVKPIIKGKNISKYSFLQSGEYLLATWFDLDIEHKYPKVYDYMKDISDKIERWEIPVRGNWVYTREDQGMNWYNLRACAYYEEFEKDKLCWQEICQEPSFCKIWKWFYLPNNAYLLTEYSDYLLWVLNSKLVFWYFKTISQSLWEEWLRYTKQYVERIPIPKKSDKNNEITRQIEEKVIKINSIKGGILQSDTSELENQIDDLVYQLYELTPEEIELVEKSLT